MDSCRYSDTPSITRNRGVLLCGSCLGYVGMVFLWFGLRGRLGFNTTSGPMSRVFCCTLIVLRVLIIGGWQGDGLIPPPTVNTKTPHPSGIVGPLLLLGRGPGVLRYLAWGVGGRGRGQYLNQKVPAWSCLWLWSWLVALKIRSDQQPRP